MTYSYPVTLRQSLAMWSIWVGLSAAGLALGFAGSTLVLESPANVVLLVGLPGVTFAFAQWSFLRSLPRANLWILVTAALCPLITVAFLSTLGSFDPDPAIDPDTLQTILLSSLLVIPMSVAQWLVLANAFHSPALWAPIAYLGWLLAFLVTRYLLFVPGMRLLPPLSPPISLALVGALLGAIQAAVTGLLLVSLKPRPLAI